MAPVPSFARDLLLGVGLALMLAGLAWHPPDWAALAPRLVDHALLATGLLAACLLAAWRLRLAPARLAWLAGLPVLASVFGGLPGLAATALLVAGGFALGSLLPAVPGLPALVRPAAGLGLLAGIAGWWLPFPVHHAAVWILALLALVAWRRSAVAGQCRALAAEVRGAVAEAPVPALVVAVMALVATAPAWLPVRMADDTAYHLLLGWELREFGHARFDLGSQVWALAPWSTDVLHALAMLMARQETTGALNAFWLLCTAWLVRGVAAQLDMPPRWGWLAAAAWTTLPMTYLLAGSLQVESATPAWFTALAAVLLARGAPVAPRLLLVATLAGILLGAKASNAILLLPFGIWMALQWRAAFPWRALAPALGLGLLAGGSSYAWAAWLAGNPVLPLANGLFGSPWFLPENFLDPTWTQGLAWDLPWQLVFAPGRYHEGGFAGAAGFLLLAGLGGLLPALAAARTRALALATLAGVALLFGMVQYLRYLQPLMPLLLLLMLAGFARDGRRWRGPALAAVVALQFAVLPAGSWSLVDPNLRLMLRKGPDAVLLRAMPERLLAKRFRDTAAPHHRLLFAESAHVAMAELPGRATSASWHSMDVWRIRRWGEDWPAMFTAAGATHVVAREDSASPALLEALEAQGATEVARAGPAVLYALAPAPVEVSVPAASGRRVRVTLPLDAEHASRGQVEVRVRCGQPLQRLALEWSLDRPGRPALQRWDQVVCDRDGLARIRAGFESLAVEGQLSLQAALPAEPGAGVLTVVEAGAERYRNPAAASERFHVVWDALCARPGCGRRRSGLLLPGDA